MTKTIIRLYTQVQQLQPALRGQT